eukprot:CAMPEP_0170608654 /NCGR_PEP_ID=MMETSP0224-20130122/21701_1 /TAXON_ID=285029 /ORGANISM="Togula jolla, Strain CCCM 725" /LENGTH=286 /DNA_ID=CAMNT_0010933897 /DNA_START=44 /DNA_END=904 /DNA_ORIENTATION=+
MSDRPYSNLDDADEGCQVKLVRTVKAHVGVKEIVMLLVLIGLAITVLMHKAFFQGLWEDFLEECTKMGLLATIPIALGCFFSECFGTPVVIFFVGAGAIFQSMYGLAKGAAVGIAACCVGLYFGCITAFWLGKSVLKPYVQKYLDEFEMLRVINKIIETEGWKFAFIMRMSPFIPIEPFNYACSVTSMSFKHNALACFGSMPMCAFEVWIAAQAANALSSGGKGGDSSLGLTIGINVVILILMVLLFISAKQKYDKYVSESEAVEDHHKKLLRKASTLRQFNALSA